MAHLTDLHRRPVVSLGYLEDCIDKVNALDADLLLLTGDYITGRQKVRGVRRHLYGQGEEVAAYARECAAAVGRAKTRHGIFACLGNHDHWFDADLITRAFADNGVNVLRNANRSVLIGGVRLSVVGLDDLWSEGVNFPAAFHHAGPGFQLVLMYNPDTFEHWPRQGPHLILSGHTHGGKVHVPVCGPPIVPSRYGDKYARGLFQRGDSFLYVNRSRGTIAPPVRFNCRPEIACFDLVSG